MLPVAMAGVALGQSLLTTQVNNKVAKAQNDSILKHMGQQLGDIALQEQQQITQLREASVNNQRQGKQSSAAARLASYTADTFGASVDEQQQEIARQMNENTARIERSEENVQDSTRRAITSAIDGHSARLSRLSGSSALFRGLLAAGGAYLNNGGATGARQVYQPVATNQRPDRSPYGPDNEPPA